MFIVFGMYNTLSSSLYLLRQNAAYFFTYNRLICPMYLIELLKSYPSNNKVQLIYGPTIMIIVVGGHGLI